MTSKSDPRGHQGLKLCVHVSVMGYYRFIIFHQNRKGSGIFLGDFTWNDHGEVTKLTWPKVTDIKNPKDTNCRHLCPYCTLQVSKSSDHWCAFGTMSNFEKRNLRSGHLMWPGGVTFRVIGSSIFGNVSYCWLNSYGGAMRRRFFRYLRKTWGGGGNDANDLRPTGDLERSTREWKSKDRVRVSRLVPFLALQLLWGGHKPLCKIWPPGPCRPNR